MSESKKAKKKEMKEEVIKEEKLQEELEKPETNEKISQLETEVSELKDKLLRKAAEFETACCTSPTSPTAA